MADLRKALASKGEALDAAKSELSDLKNQVKDQLTELQLARTDSSPFPCSGFRHCPTV